MSAALAASAITENVKILQSTGTANARSSLHPSLNHPCFSSGATLNHGRVHLPVSPVCNIQCRFCKRSFNKFENRPGVSARLLAPKDAVDLVKEALERCPDITVAGIAGPGDTLATTHAIETFALIHQAYPALIKCLSTNGLLLERYAQDLAQVGVKTLTVTVNAVDPVILHRICSHVMLDGKVYTGVEGAVFLISAQERGIQEAADIGFTIKINIVLIPGVNDTHIADIARAAHDWGASIINIIPLIPQHEFAEYSAPDCDALSRAREAAEAYLPVFRHCQHCRADAIGIPGKGDFASLIYGENRTPIEETFSHG
ncbi:MAG: radical SAM protein [Treponema sp.]|jgi:nitrogen fixation protein NifB|nr:radical SAM protein [Treponema sp.]